MNLLVRIMQAALIAVLVVGGWTAAHPPQAPFQSALTPTVTDRAAVQDGGEPAPFTTATGDPSWCGPLAAYLDWSLAQESHGDYRAKAAAGARAASRAATITGLPSHTRRYLHQLAAWERTYARSVGEATAVDQRESQRLFTALGTDVMQPLSHSCGATIQYGG